MDISLAPSQRSGMRTGASEEAEAPTRHDAILLFEAAKARLLDVNRWHTLCGPGSAEFTLCDESGTPITGRPQIGNLIRIRLPGPGNSDGGGYDWVRIEAFEEKKDLLRDEDTFGFRSRPAKAPDGQSATAHFFHPDATSTFVIMRRTTSVMAIEKGRNEKPNTKGLGFLSRVRNVAIVVGAWLGISKSQWSLLMKGLINGPRG